MQYQSIESLRKTGPLIHNITNYVTVTDCANLVLAIGASPIMSDDVEEVEDIISICDALVINLGTLNRCTIQSMLFAGRKANDLNKPVILDPVGNGASPLRTKITNKIIQEVKLAVIRGNISEIKMAALGMGQTRGVDANASDASDLESTLKIAKGLASSLGSVIAITGATDIISDGNQSCAIKNGHPLMSRITGTGCMCSALIGSFCGASSDYFSASATAVGTMGLAGELAYAKLAALGPVGTGSLRNGIIDAISLMDDPTFERGIKIEDI